MILSVFLIIIGFSLLVIGADILVDGASGIAKNFFIPEIIIGLTIVSIGTSMPELFVSLTAAIEDHPDMAIGNVVGSNIVNLLIILGLVAIIRPITFKKETMKHEIPICFVVTSILIIFCNTGYGISTFEAICLLTLCGLFILYTIYMAKKEQSKKIIEIGISQNENTLKNIFWIILGLIGLKIGGDLVIDHSAIVARYFKLSEKIISLTILAAGTSLPELVTSVMAAIKGNSDIAIRECYWF